MHGLEVSWIVDKELQFGGREKQLTRAWGQISKRLVNTNPELSAQFSSWIHVLYMYMSVDLKAFISH